MKRTMTLLLGSFIVGIMAFAVPGVAGAQPPTGSMDSQHRITFNSGPLTGVFEGNVPHVTFYATSDLGRVTYQLNFRALIEFSTSSSSGDQVYESPLMVARADFDSASWTPSNFYSVKDTSGTIIGMGFNFTLNSHMQIVENTGQPQTLKPGDVVLVVKAYNTTRTITSNGPSVTVNTAEMKIDFVLTDWPFTSSSDKLALQVNMHSDYNHFDLDQQTGSSAVDATHDEGSQVTEHEYQETPNTDQEVRYVSTPVTASSNIGFFHFVNTATITPSTGASYNVHVLAAYKGERDGDLIFFKLYLVYPYFPMGSTLVHDPSFGLQGGIPTLFIVAGGAGIAALAAVLAIRHRHTQVQRYSEQR